MVGRIEKINSLILEQLSKVVVREIEFPKNVFVTLQRVETSKDLAESRVFIAVFPQENSKQIMLLLNKQARHLHYLLSKKIVLRKTPHLRFLLQNMKTDPERVSGLLDEIAVENKLKND